MVHGSRLSELSSFCYNEGVIGAPKSSTSMVQRDQVVQSTPLVLNRV
jgi:hypothetical protein